MTPPTDTNGLATELTSLGQTLRSRPVAEDVISRATAEFLASPVLTRRQRWRFRLAAWAGRVRRRLIALVILIIVLGIGVTPPVRATVNRWLSIGGVLVVSAPTPPTSLPPSAPPSLPDEVAVTMEQAAAMVSFPVRSPRQLGAPGRVTVSGDRRVVGMTWDTTPWGVIHLDQFDGQLSYGFIKQAWNEITQTRVNGRDAYWLDRPHTVTFVDSHGKERHASARMAGRTLIFEAPLGSQQLTYRLEGELIMTDAVTLMEMLS